MSSGRLHRIPLQRQLQPVQVCLRKDSHRSISYVHCTLNLVKHQKTKRCTINTSKATIQEPRAKKLGQPKFRQLLVSAIIDGILLFLEVASPQLPKLFVEGILKEHQTVPSIVTASRDEHAQFDHIHKSLTEALSCPQSHVSVTFELKKNRSARNFLSITGHLFSSLLRLCAPLLSILHIYRKPKKFTRQIQPSNKLQVACFFFLGAIERKNILVDY